MKKLNFCILFLFGFLLISSQAFSQVTPTAGATETFNVTGGELFTDPGGAGADCTSFDFGNPPMVGNYPNCNCVTVSTLCADPGQTVTVDFTEFKVFAEFDWMVIYDGDAAVTATSSSASGTNPTSTDTELYNSFNDGDDLALMTASTGTSFTSSAECLTFALRLSGAVSACGWEANVSVSGGGGGGGAAVPTMSQWGLFLFALCSMTLGLVFMFKQATAQQLAGGKGQTGSFQSAMPFDMASYKAAMPHALGLAVVGFALILVIWGEIIPMDLVGMMITIPVVAYMISISKMMNKLKS